MLLFTRFHHLLAAVAMLMAAPMPALAALYCVSTGQQLQDALTAASDNGVDDEIRITTGSKSLTPLPNRNFMFTYHSTRHENLVLSGGWNAGCTQQNPNPRSTQLSGLTARSVLAVYLHGEAIGDIEIRNLALYSGRTPDWQLASGLHIIAEGNADPDVLVDRVVAALNEADTAAASAAIVVEQRQAGIGRYTLRNLMVEGNLQRALWLNTQPLATYRVNNSTFIANQPPSPDHATVYVAGTGYVWMANNVIAGNTVQVNLQLHHNTPAYLRNNHINGLDASSGLFNLAMTSGDPRLELDANGWWRPMPVSPLRDSGFNLPNGGTGDHDVIGSARVRGPTVDRGAIEAAPNVDTLFRNGFQ